ncbi:hypothetical protein N752_01455 [Desulforamulus aquiferis]|nr:hypothetical protein N752_01455 [Desulforamulus aquiferis]
MKKRGRGIGCNLYGVALDSIARTIPRPMWRLPMMEV